jgi:hypothetical protein
MTETFPTHGKYILTDQHEVVEERDLKVWARWVEDHQDESQVALDIIDEQTGAYISTRFFGLNLNLAWDLERAHPPVVFETMVFGGPLHLQQQRYHTWAQAVAGHAALLARAKAAHD